MKRITKTNLMVLLFSLLIGGMLGWLIKPSDDQIINTSDHQHVNTSDHQTIESSETWTCSMHPQVRQPEPGQCPICGMDLIPASTSGGAGSSSPAVLEMSEAAIALAEVQTFTVKSNESGKELSTTGKVQPNERSRSTLAANFPGRIEQLFINFTGQSVRKGEKLAEVYSPELVNAQKELLEAARTKSDFPDLYAAARQKLRSWKITTEQIESIESGGELIERFAVLADRSGIVIQRNVAEGDYVTTGTPLFEIVNLNTVWVMLDIYEQQLPFVRIGDKVSLTVEGIPGETFESTVSYLDPFIDADTRTAEARVVLNNPHDRLMPEMFVNANIQSSGNLGEGTLSIPRTALLWSGNRSVVYVQVPDTTYPTYEMREVTIGPRNGEIYPVLDGLQAGEEVVSNGVFSIDAAAQLAGNYSLLNRPESNNLQVSQAFRQELTAIAEQYFTLKNALVEDDAAAAIASAADISQFIQETTFSLDENTTEESSWTGIKDRLQAALTGVEQSGSLETVRVHFEGLSDAMWEITETFGLEKEVVYRQYCPMAFGDSGAYWLSETEPIRNPYFGAGMLSCGEVRDIYKKDDLTNKKEAPSAAPAGATHQH